MDVLESVDEDIPERMEKEENIEKLYGYIEKKSDGTRKVNYPPPLWCVRGKGTPEHPEITQREIAKQLGISRSYVSRIEKKHYKSFGVHMIMEGEKTEMSDPKIENLLELSLDVSEDTREKSENLSAGYDPEEKLWQVIIRYSGELCNWQVTMSG